MTHPSIQSFVTRSSLDRRRCKRARHAFTLVELLVVIAIIGVMVGLLLPAVQSAREAARRMSCSNNLKQVGLALHMYHNTYKQMPTASTTAEITEQRPPSWLVKILPFMEQSAAWDRTTFNGTDFASRNDGINRNWETYNGLIVPSFNCPSSPLPQSRFDDASPETVALGAPETLEIQIPNYVGVAGDYNERKSQWNGYAGMSDYNGVIVALDNGNHEPVKFASILDGTSHTLAVGEQSDFVRVRPPGQTEPEFYDQRAGNWFGGAWSGGGGGPNNGPEGYRMNVASTRVGINYSPTNRFLDPYGIGPYWYGRPGNHTIFNSTHGGGAQFLKSDGSVEFISENIRFEIFSLLSNREDRKVIEQF
ncbi:DUF1559 domain-containing protein [Roseiconus nitratireducens]|uniref:DUF1559 domain-containing protein n=2 Tax=Roseiconus nitratireducens TaxID=2605748 RepID=A0A5M6CXY8_9BACT|nr:DUF1559 domain-containing protein [Roseiconus nitratireducens]